MTNFSINFIYPWLLLLFIPAAILTFFAHFRLQKRYRRNRNRITSIVLHLIVMVLSITVLAGITFSYDKPNTENELIILVDVSDSNVESNFNKKAFVRDVIDESAGMFKLGVVTFGFDQVFTSTTGKLSSNTEKVWEDYLNADLPNTTATNIAGALNFARTLFETPETAKIVVITDGIETDGNAVSTVKSVVAEGIAVDTVYFPTVWGDDVQLIGATLPDYNILPGDEFAISLTVQSSFVGNAKVTITDTDEDGNEEKSEFDVQFVDDINELQLKHRLANPGLHKLKFEISGASNDTLVENNEFYSYIYLEEFDKILIIDKYEGESDTFKGLLEEEENGGYTVTTINASDKERMPASLEILRDYEQVVLYNVANSDLPEGFVEILHEYVEVIGGGLFTVGGNQKKDDGTDITNNYGEVISNAYNRDDMRDTLLQEMLPVKAVDYSPPVAVMIVIDTSGSMGTITTTGETKLELAKKGAKSCLEALTERDYAGVMTFSDDYLEEIEVTPLTQKSKISQSIDMIADGGGTVFTGALDRAGIALASLGSLVERRHIILVTDAEPSDSFESYGAVIKRNYENNGITFSMVAIEYSAASFTTMEQAVALGNGRFYDIKDASTLPDTMRGDLNVKDIKAYNPENFTPIIDTASPIFANISQTDVPQLGGFYGTQLKEGAEAPLMSEYVPVYAQWKYGEGTVGSFMCDLNGVWSNEFITNQVGLRILSNIIVGLFPTSDISAKDIELQFKDDNYTTQMSVFTDMSNASSIGVTVTSPIEEDTGIFDVQQIETKPGENYSRIKFLLMQPGIHEILVEKKSGTGSDTIIQSDVTLYKAFSYSKEYNAFVDPTACIELVNQLAASGKGTVVSADEPWDIFDDYETHLHIVIDPRIVFIIIALCCFLLDKVVCKFKFKWPNEIIRDYKAKKALNNKGKR